MPVAASVERKPDLAVLGYVAGVSDPKITSAGNHAMMMFDLQPLNDLGKARKYCFLYRPEWFVRGFCADTLSYGQRFLFGKHIVDQENYAALQAFVGTKENYAALDEIAYNLAEHTVETVGLVIKEFVLSLGQIPFIYILQQGKKGTGTYNEKGKEVKIFTPYYEVGEFLPADARGKRSVEAKVAYAQRTAAKKSQEIEEPVEPLFQVAFDLDTIR